MSEWQPIETAPRDGREIIVGVDVASVWIVRSAWYRGPEVIEQQPETFDESDIGWWSYISSITQEKLEGIYEPTHWLCEVGVTPDRYADRVDASHGSSVPRPEDGCSKFSRELGSDDEAHCTDPSGKLREPAVLTR